jgi:hypothetical protein
MISAHSTEDVSSFLLQQNSELESFYHIETSYWFNKIATGKEKTSEPANQARWASHPAVTEHFRFENKYCEDLQRKHDEKMSKIRPDDLQRRR